MSYFLLEGNTVSSKEIVYQQIKINTQTLLIEEVGLKLGVPDYKCKDSEFIFPGFIDIHVHAREDATGKQTYKEDFETVSQAAINGGVVAIMDMPNNFLAPIDDESYEQKLKLTKNKDALIIPFAGVGPTSQPITGRHVPYKAYMGPSVGDLYFMTNEELDEKLKQYVGVQISFHCEDPQVLAKNRNCANHEQARPELAEIKAVELAIELTQKYNLHSVVCHLSTQKGLELCLEAKRKGIHIQVEVAPHHLFFNTQMFDRFERKLLQVNPPIRSQKDQEFLLDAFKKGLIDFLATDHAPHAVNEKQLGMSGLTHLDTYGPFVSWLIGQHQVSPQTIALCACENPAVIINKYLPYQLGQLKPGYYGKVTVLDTQSPFTVDSTELKTKNHWSPFLGVTFPGRARVFPLSDISFQHNHHSGQGDRE